MNMFVVVYTVLLNVQCFKLRIDLDLWFFPVEEKLNKKPDIINI